VIDALEAAEALPAVARFPSKGKAHLSPRADALIKLAGRLQEPQRSRALRFGGGFSFSSNDRPETGTIRLMAARGRSQKKAPRGRRGEVRGIRGLTGIYLPDSHGFVPPKFSANAQRKAPPKRGKGGGFENTYCLTDSCHSALPNLRRLVLEPRTHLGIGSMTRCDASLETRNAVLVCHQL
jgi:hypothetical protein